MQEPAGGQDPTRSPDQATLGRRLVDLAGGWTHGMDVVIGINGKYGGSSNGTVRGCNPMAAFLQILTNSFGYPDIHLK